ALTDGMPVPPSTILYERGNADWTCSFQEDATTADGPGRNGAATRSEPLSVRLAAMSHGRERGVGRVAPSRQGESAKIRLRQLAHDPSSRARERGTLIH